MCTVVNSQEHEKDKKQVEAKGEGVCVKPTGGNGGDAEAASFPMISPWPLAPLEKIRHEAKLTV